MRQQSFGMLTDYKFYCFNGEPEYVYVSYNRPLSGDLNVDINLYDMDWKSHPEWIRNMKGHHYNEKEITKPVCFEQMVIICRELSRPFPEVRVDLYEINNKPIIGELTFSTGYGFFTNEFYDYLGSKVDLSQAKAK